MQYNGKNILILYVTFITIIIGMNNLWAKEITYIHPLPNSKLVSPATSIIVRFKNKINTSEVKNVKFSIYGEISGQHDGQLIKARKNRTIIFQPTRPFDPGEKVQIGIHSQSPTISISQMFTTSPNSQNSRTSFMPDSTLVQNTSATSVDETVNVINGVSVPSDFPIFKPTINTNPSDGMLFVSNYDRNYIMILHNDGSPYYYRKSNSRCWDFTIQPDSVISYVAGRTPVTLDNHFEEINRYHCSSNYETDHHEFRLLPNGNALLIVEDIQIIDMSQLVEGGRTEAKVVGNHIQEVDPDGNVLFEWRCWDHYNITDALHENMKSPVIHAVHMNAIDVDFDGNILVSSRHLDEITKINRTTGDIIWRFGGLNNQFTFLNDLDGFTYQHDIRAVPGKPGNYTIMDNGNFHDPRYSRAVEYKLDTLTMTAEKVWEYRHEPDRYTKWMGNVQRLENGNTVIGWSLNSLPKMTEVTSDGNIVYEANFLSNNTSYRVHRFACTAKAVRPYLIAESFSDRICLIFNQFGATNIAKYYIYADTTDYPSIRIDSTTNPYINLTNFDYRKRYYFRVTSVDSDGIESDFSNQVNAYAQFIEPGQNLIKNGDFSLEDDFWLVNVDDIDADWEIDDTGLFHALLYSSNGDAENFQLIQNGIQLIWGKHYRLKFDCYAEPNGILEIKLIDDDSSINYGQFGFVSISRHKQKYLFEFTMDQVSTSSAMLCFNFAYSIGDFYLDNVELSEKTTAIGIDDDDDTITDQSFCVHDNYPNPFNSTTNIRYSIPQSEKVMITVYNIRGQVVLGRQLNSQPAGEHLFQFDSSAISSGIYFYRITAHSATGKQINSDIIKMVCIK
ncbi:aryl-sulfate sulfotransferase [candidate division KSB1 bacterium]|nr:aryl-sulfate sulfotransferase [candidate division KSB1 bacterium]